MQEIIVCLIEFICQTGLFYIDALPLIYIFTTIYKRTNEHHLMIHKIWWRLRLYSLTSIELWLCGLLSYWRLVIISMGRDHCLNFFSWLLHDFYVSLDIIMRWAGTYIAITCASNIKRLFHDSKKKWYWL